MSEYRVAVIGCGSRSHDHIRAYEQIPGASVVACCAPNPGRRDQVAATYGLRAYADPAAMLDQEKPDLVHLVTWPDTRVELMTLVAAKGVPACTVEKPIATGVADWRALCDLERRSRTRFAVCHQVRWHENVVRCQQALASGDLGETLFVEMTAGMNIAGQGTHILNYGRSLMAEARVTTVFGNAGTWDPTDPGHPGTTPNAAHLSFDNGRRGLWVTGPIAPRCGDPNTTWQHVRVAAYAERGRVTYEEFAQWEVVGPGGEQHGDCGGMEGWKIGNLAAQAGFHRAMLAWLEDETQVPGTNLEASLHEWHVVLALYASALRGQAISLGEFVPEDDLVEQIRGR